MHLEILIRYSCITLVNVLLVFIISRLPIKNALPKTDIDAFCSLFLK